MRRAVGITSYHRVTPIHKPAKPRLREDKPRWQCQELKLVPDPTSEEIKEIDRLNRQMDLAGQAIIALVLISGSWVLGLQISKWLGWW
jgi:hypothetical protein